MVQLSPHPHRHEAIIEVAFDESMLLRLRIAHRGDIGERPNSLRVIVC